ATRYATATCTRCAALARRRNFAHSFQLIVGQAHRVQERDPTRVPVELRKERIASHEAQASVALPARSLQPFERSVLVPSIRVDFGDEVGGRIGEALGYSGEGKIGVRH